MRKWILIIGFLILTYAFAICQDKADYKIEIREDLWKTEPIIPNKHFDDKYLNDGNLYIHFQSAFKNDSVEIKINGKYFDSYLLTTEWSTELADVIKIPDLENIQELSVALNKGKEAKIKIDSLNQIIVRYRNYTLMIGKRKHVSNYD